MVEELIFMSGTDDGTENSESCARIVQSKKPEDIIIKPPRVNLYCDQLLPNGRTVGEMLNTGQYKIPASAQQEDPLIVKQKTDDGVEIVGHTVAAIDNVPASVHQFQNMTSSEWEKE